ncbi:hypothetical protein [Luteolibacter sp. LG18]|uniref:hypothetical protein n=1 Tax=Luteolibacter sp. LG18 TaxID=2819286 RepID=UPI002B2FABF9|nr:hypothetical protein llg_20600 [Luteolibacter sp. LG18]
MIRLHLIILTLFSLILQAHAGSSGMTWGSETLADKTTWTNSASYSGDWARMVLTEGRNPFVVYLDRTAAPCLRSVVWENGNRRDDLMFTLPTEIDTLRVVSSGSHIAVAWAYYSNTYRTILCSRRTATGWTTPEIVFSNSLSTSWDLAMTSDGEPFVVVTKDGTGFGSTQVKLLKHQGSAWTEENVLQQTGSIGKIALLVSPGDAVTIAWASVTDQNAAQAYYAVKAGSQWTRLAATGAGTLGALFAGPSGEPYLIGTPGMNYPPVFLPLLPDGSGVAVPIPGDNLDVSSAATAPDGTIRATQLGNLISRINGVWSISPCPSSYQVLADADGAFHLLGQDQSLLRYETLIPQTWDTPEDLTTYEQGSATLDSLALDPAGDPKLFAWLTSELKFSKTGGLWQSAVVDLPSPGWNYAYDNLGVLQAFNGATGKYATPGSDGKMQISSLPVSVTSSSSDNVYALAIDGAKRPHVGFYTGMGTSSAAIMYAVKTGSTWTVETVTSTGSSGQQCALALDPGGVSWMFTEKGLFRRGASGWVHEYAATNCKIPGLGIASDGMVHAVFCNNGWLYSLAGKNGSYTLGKLDYVDVLSTQIGFAMAGNRPMVIYRRLLDYGLTRNVLVHAEKVGNRWRQRFITPVANNTKFGSQIKLAADSRGGLTLAATRNETRGSYSRTTLLACHNSLPDPEPAALALLLSVTPEGRHRFSMNLDTAPYWRPIVLQSSPDLSAWTSLFRIGADFASFPLVEGLSIRGDAFRTGLIFDAPAGAAHHFMRLAPVTP